VCLDIGTDLSTEDDENNEANHHDDYTIRDLDHELNSENCFSVAYNV